MEDEPAIRALLSKRAAGRRSGRRRRLNYTADERAAQEKQNRSEHKTHNFGYLLDHPQIVRFVSSFIPTD